VVADRCGIAAARHSTMFLALLGLSAAVVGIFGALGDYPQDAAPVISSLADGHLAAAFHSHALMGSLSLVLRAPLVVFTNALGLGATAAYRAGAFACFVPAAALGAWLAGSIGGNDPWSSGGRALVAVLAVANPVTAEALANGHPEEVLGAALVVGAVVLALRGRSTSAAVVLGLALATKQWAIVAVAPAVLAAPRAARRRLVLVGVAVAAFLTVPALIADGSAFAHVSTQAATTPASIGSTNVWFLVAHPVVLHLHHVLEGQPAEFTVFKAPGWVGRVSHPVIVCAALPLAGLLARRRVAPTADQTLALLALAFLFRSVLDPVDNAYYHVPLLTALLAWETVGRCRRLPVLSTLTALALWLTFDRVAPGARPAVTNAVYLLWTVPLAAYLVYALDVIRPRSSREIERGNPSNLRIQIRTGRSLTSR
jgi:hypothetical protein